MAAGRPSVTVPVGSLTGLLALLFLLLAAGQMSSRRRAATEPMPRLTSDPADFEAGDVLFRHGRSFLSLIVTASDRGAAYSHVGVVAMVDNVPVVIHAEPINGLGQTSLIQATPIAEFLASEKALRGALYRIDGTNAAIASKAAAVAQRYYAQRLDFDSSFSLKSSDRLYCTELVWRAFLEAGIDLAGGKFDEFKSSKGKKHGLYPSRLIRSPHLRMVREYRAIGRSQ